MTVGMPVQPHVDGAVDAADEEAGDAGDFRNVAAGGGKILETGEIGFHDLFVDADREQQGDVDVQPASEQLPDGGKAGRGPRDLHHQVGPVHGRPQPQRLADRRFRVVGEIGRALQADIAVAPLRGLIDALEGVGGGADVGDGEMFVDLADPVVGVRLELRQRLVIVAGFADGLLEDRGIGRQSHQAVALDQLA